MLAGGQVADAEPPRDFLVRAAQREQRQHLAFTGGGCCVGLPGLVRLQRIR